MRILFLGAGATGGYFGGRLTAIDAGVTFLVRARRAAQLAAQGLVIESPFGNLSTPVKTVTAASDAGVQDIVVLSCKFFDLASAIEAIRPSVGPSTLVLPVLNGMKHLDLLDQAFGPDRVLGGSCHLSVALGDDGVIRHLNQLHALTFGPRRDIQSEACARLLEIMLRANFDPKVRSDIEQAMWDKWVLLASLAGLTCTVRASVGEIAAAPGGPQSMLALIDECRQVARNSGFEPSGEQMQTIRTLLTDPASKVVASMLRDMQKGSRIEADLIIGDMLRRAHGAGIEAPLLSLAAANLACYEAARLIS